jgi:hypothetical protein
MSPGVNHLSAAIWITMPPNIAKGNSGNAEKNLISSNASDWYWIASKPRLIPYLILMAGLV